MNFRLDVFVLVLSAILITNLASATIEGSKYEERHQSAIEKSIYEQCGITGQLFELGSVQVKDSIDNGITDIHYTTSILVRSRIDQGLFDEYTFVVQSNFSDAYDHGSKNWGVYTVDSISSSDRSCQ